MKYITVDEDYIIRWADEITQDDIDAVKSGVLEIARMEDMMQLNRNGEWVEMKQWDSKVMWGSES